MSSYLHRYAQESIAREAVGSEGLRQAQASLSNSEMIARLNAADGGERVELCRRVAQIPVAEQAGLEHWWLRTDEAELGMGPANGEVPGRSRSPDMPFTRTTLNDHTGQGDDPGSICIAPEQQNPAWASIDPECIAREMQLGKDTGRWAPLFNDCQTWASSALDRCATGPKAEDR